MERRGNKRN